MRLGVTLWYAEQTRRRGAAKRIKPVGVVSVDLRKPDEPLEQPQAEGEISPASAHSRPVLIRGKCA